MRMEREVWPKDTGYSEEESRCTYTEGTFINKKGRTSIKPAFYI
jgi:hypothetical protein